MASPDVLVVGADGALGRLLVHALDATGVTLRAPGPGPPAPPAALGTARVIVNVAGPRVRPGLGWVDYVREHVGTACAVARAAPSGAHVIHVSSSAVYGANRAETVGPASAEAPLLFPSASYASAKLSAELAVRALCGERGVPCTVLRPPVVYGPGLGSAVESLLRLARRGLVLQLRPDSVRQHGVHVALLVDAVRVLVASGPRGPAPLVVCDPFVTTNADLNAAVRARARGVRVSVSLPALAALLRRWPGYPTRPGPSALEAFAVLGYDLEYDWADAFARLGLDPAAYARERTFDPYVALL